MSEMPVIGWREWVALPALGVKRVKAKVDSGARSSSLHAFDIDDFTKDGEDWVRFEVHPRQNDNDYVVRAEAKVHDRRSVRSSSGVASFRTVILTEVKMFGESWPIELTLANRDEMGFRMLLGREAFRGRYLVDAAQSYLAGKPKRRRQAK